MSKKVAAFDARRRILNASQAFRLNYALQELTKLRRRAGSRRKDKRSSALALVPDSFRCLAREVSEDGLAVDELLGPNADGGEHGQPAVVKLLGHHRLLSRLVLFFRNEHASHPRVAQGGT